MNKRRRHLFLGSLLFLCSAWPAAGQTETPKLPATGVNCCDLMGRGIKLPVSEKALRRVFVTHTMTPEYPVEAQQAGIQGQVRLHVVFNRKGHLQQARVSESPHRLLSEAVLKAVKGWRIKEDTFTRGGSGLTLGELRFVFTLKDGQAEVTDAPEEEQRKLVKTLEEDACIYLLSPPD
ncbi:MAG TPA: energy transducer TonB [Pyrinomonadaceae bacterium]|nr:energy transducer TonB [Pyrinomonadaceae bacterium]